MLDKLSVGVNGYDAYDGYINHQVLAEIEKYNVPHIYRGTYVLATRGSVTSTSFRQEIEDWFKEQKFSVILSCTEQFSYPSLHLFTKKDADSTGPAVLCSAIFHADNMNFDIYAEKTEEGAKLVSIFEEKFKTGTKSSGGNIKFAFWQHDTEDDCTINVSNKQCPTLEEISSNYSDKLIKQIKDIIELKEPYQHGKIILYHGPAGNGKTHLIRALARAWNELHGVIPEVIIDPEQLYELPKYLTGLLLNGSSQVYSSKVEPPFRLIIAEDSAQLFATDCRNQSGFSRLLNTVDGLLGQGQKLIFVFTANEQIDDIDPAILRPGRCLQNLEVPNWNRRSAVKWLKDKGVENISLPNEISLAELYAITNKTMHAEQLHKSLGF